MCFKTSICSHYFPEESGLSILFCAAVTYFYIDVHNSLFLFGGGSQDEPAFKRYVTEESGGERKNMEELLMFSSVLFCTNRGGGNRT